MISMIQKLQFSAIAAMACAQLASPVCGGCNCQGGEGSLVSYPAPAETYFVGAEFSGQPVYPQSIQSGPGVMPEVNYNPAPPPGTIGRTYQLPSVPVPVKKHPRTGMLDVRVVGATEVIVHDINPMRTEDLVDGFRDANDPNLWHFATEPLYPGLQHLYRVEARFGDPDHATMQERYVRLVRGRVIQITF